LPVDAVNAGIDSSSFKKADYPDRMHPNRRVTVAQGFQRRLQRILAPQLLERPQRAHADKRMTMLDQRQDRVSAGRILQFGHAVGGGRGHDTFGSTSNLTSATADAGPSNSPSAIATC
jgi:hypothetical protein